MKGQKFYCKHRQFGLFGKCNYFNRQCIKPCKFTTKKNKLAKGVDATNLQITKKGKKK